MKGRIDFTFFLNDSSHFSSFSLGFLPLLQMIACKTQGAEAMNVSNMAWPKPSARPRAHWNRMSHMTSNRALICLAYFRTKTRYSPTSFAISRIPAKGTKILMSSANIFWAAFWIISLQISLNMSLANPINPSPMYSNNTPMPSCLNRAINFGIGPSGDMSLSSSSSSIPMPLSTASILMPHNSRLNFANDGIEKCVGKETFALGSQILTSPSRIFGRIAQPVFLKVVPKWLKEAFNELKKVLGSWTISFETSLNLWIISDWTPAKVRAASSVGQNIAARASAFES